MNKACNTHEATGRHLEGVLEPRAGELARGFLPSRQLAGGREGEREKEGKKDRHGGPSSDGAKAFY